jgi:sugar phosphate isomerase/epimerase
MNIGVFTVMLPDLTPEAATTALKETGYDGVEWRVTRVPEVRQGEQPSFWGNNLCTLRPDVSEASRAKALSQQAGLAIPNIGSYIGLAEMEKVVEALAFASNVGAAHFRIGFGNFQGNYTQHFNNARAFLADVIAMTKGSGVKPLVEIHHKTIIPSCSLTHRLLSHFNPDEVGAIHDAGNMVHEGFEDYRMGLEVLGDYLAHVHIKNATYARPEGGGVWHGQWAALEDGVVDFVALFAALKAIDYDGWLVVEDFSNVRPSHEALAFNCDFIKQKWAEA